LLHSIRGEGDEAHGLGVAAVVGGLLLAARPDAGAQAQGDAIRVLISTGLRRRSKRCADAEEL
jgi:hypothetical protein